MNLGMICKAYRKSQGFHQHDVAREIGCSIKNISAFENGRNRNYEILMCYVRRGLIVDNLMEERYADKD